MSGHTDYVHDISLKSDGNTLASASEDGSVNIWGQCFVYTHTFIKVLFSMKKNCNEVVLVKLWNVYEIEAYSTIPSKKKYQN